jgi:SAM-dependent methyltransferase
VILERFLPRVREYGHLLDLGCGYGRLSQIVRASRPDLELIGVDFSRTFCQLYHEGTSSPAVCADIARLPLQAASFDALLSVTSLMYVPRAQRNEAMASLIKLLRPGGTALFIEPGEEFLSMATRLSPSSASPTSGLWFRLGEYDALGADHAEILDTGGFPVLSALLPVLQKLGATRAPLGPLLTLTTGADRVLRNWRRFSVYRWMILGR